MQMFQAELQPLRIQTYLVLKERILSHLKKKNFFFKRLYLFIHETQREAETQAEGEAGSMQGP